MREKTDITSALRPLISDFRSVTSFLLSVLIGFIWCSLVLFGPEICFCSTLRTFHAWPVRQMHSRRVRITRVSVGILRNSPYNLTWYPACSRKSPG